VGHRVGLDSVEKRKIFPLGGIEPCSSSLDRRDSERDIPAPNLYNNNNNNNNTTMA
jgi:hypothetical protein